MSTSDRDGAPRRLVWAAALTLTSLSLPVSVAIARSHQAEGKTVGPRLGRPVSAADIAAMDFSVDADGTGLPAGSGTVADGSATYAAKCEACHGASGGGALSDRLTGGVGSMPSKKPVKTVASYWPYAPTLFDYIRRAMPFTAPQSLSDDEVYGIVAYLLSIDHIVAPGSRLDAKTLSSIVMPNRHGFVSLENKAFDGNINGPTARH